MAYREDPRHRSGPGLTPEQRAAAWALEKMCEDHLYWIAVRGRWLDDANFARGPAQTVPERAGPAAAVHQQSRSRQGPQGAASAGRRPFRGRRGGELGLRDVETLATLLGDKPYFFGDGPCGADATFFAFIASGLAPIWEFAAARCGGKNAKSRSLPRPDLQTYFPEFIVRMFCLSRASSNARRLRDELHVFGTREPMVALRDERHDDRIRRELFGDPKSVTPGYDLIADPLKDMHRRIGERNSRQKANAGGPPRADGGSGADFRRGPSV